MFSTNKSLQSPLSQQSELFSAWKVANHEISIPLINFRILLDCQDSRSIRISNSLFAFLHSCLFFLDKIACQQASFAMLCQPGIHLRRKKPEYHEL